MTRPRLDNRPLALRAYQRLLEEIVRGTRPAGARISEESIAQELGISRTPAREALMRLSADGLVERIPRKGCHIAAFDKEEAKDRFQCRALLEGVALDLAFEHLDQPALHALEAELQAIVPSDNTASEASLAADGRLHELILAACPNRSLVEIVLRLQQQCQAFRAFRAIQQPVAPLTAERLEIVQSLLRGERDRARHLLTQHILNGIHQAIDTV